jgi:DNA (cytosine-5)-methyltransferase 1
VSALAIGSLFSGIGGLDLGLECALRDEGFDVSTIWQCEQDAWCRGILARHWPDALRYDDVRNVGTDAARVDILCGGFPCQDVSYAGKGAGLAGERSGLWFQFARIVRDLRPRIVVVENVAALASRGLDTVLGSLSEAGYDAVWFDVRASDVGAPHGRERLFVVAWLVADTNEAASPQPNGKTTQAGRRASRRRDDGGCVRLAGQRPAQDEPGVHRVGDGVPARVDIAAVRWANRPHRTNADDAPMTTEVARDRSRRHGALGNAVVPQVGYVVGCVVAEVLRGTRSCGVTP